MLNLLYELLVNFLPQSTGRAIVYVVTLGRVRIEDEWASMIGWISWIVAFIAIEEWIARR